MKKLLFTTTAIISLILTGCSDNKDNKKAEASKDKSKTTTVASSPTTTGNATAPTQSYLADVIALQKAEDSLKALPQFAGKPLKVFQDFQFYDDKNSRIEINLQDPNKPENVDHYTYKFAEGKWSEPKPVQIMGNGKLDPNLTALEQVPFKQVANVVKLWKEKAVEIKPSETTPNAVMFNLFVPNQTRAWMAYMKNERASYTLRMTLDGKLKSFDKE